MSYHFSADQRFKPDFRIYSGNYDTFCATKSEQDESQMKLYKKEQADLAAMKEYVARFGHGSRKLAKQGKSKEKLMNKRIAEGMTEKVHREKTVSSEKMDYIKILFFLGYFQIHRYSKTSATNFEL